MLKFLNLFWSRVRDKDDNDNDNTQLSDTEELILNPTLEENPSLTVEFTFTVCLTFTFVSAIIIKSVSFSGWKQMAVISILLLESGYLWHSSEAVQWWPGDVQEEAAEVLPTVIQRCRKPGLAGPGGPATGCRPGVVFAHHCDTSRENGTQRLG